MTDHDCYKQINTPEGVILKVCPVCSSAAQLWRFSEDPNGPTETLVACSNGEPFGPQVRFINDGCLLYLPPQEFYHGTIKEAVKYWNEYAKSLLDQRSNKDNPPCHIYDWLTLVEQRIGTPAAIEAARVLKDFYEGADTVFEQKEPK